jgi:hypothetical protein
MLLAIWLTVLIFSGTGAIWPFLSADPVNVATAERIKPGMSKAEVKAILGPGKQSWIMSPQTADRWEVLDWTGRKGTISVIFRQDGAVNETNFYPGPELTFLDRLRRLLPW